MNLKEIEDRRADGSPKNVMNLDYAWPDWLKDIDWLISRVKELEGEVKKGITYQGIYFNEGQAVMLLSEVQKENTKLKALLNESLTEFPSFGYSRFRNKIRAALGEK